MEKTGKFVLIEIITAISLCKYKTFYLSHGIQEDKNRGDYYFFSNISKMTKK